MKNLYKLDVDGCAALMGKADKVVSQDEGELHHGAFKIMQQICTELPKGTLAQIDTCKGCNMGSVRKPCDFTFRGRLICMQMRNSWFQRMNLKMWSNH